MLSLLGQAAKAEECGLCDRTVVINSDLASCFLEKYPQYAQAGSGAVVVDLSECFESRGVVEALAPPGVVAEEPNLQFMLSRAQLACLKQKLEEPGLVLDPSARIDLESCE